ncbi:MAG: YicC family protein [Rhodospirillales bacterium]|nr:YicC family protein [Rhodospirillales bacterium]
MTGYARNEGSGEHCSWTWEARGVNGKGLDVRCRLPAGFDAMEAVVRERVKQRLVRGNISLSLSIEWLCQGGAYAINEDVLSGYIAMMPELNEKIPGLKPPTLDGLLALKGVIEPRDEAVSEQARAALQTVLLSDLEETLSAMIAMRADEGARLADVLSQQVATIEDLCAAATKTAAMRPDAIRLRLKQQVEALLADAPSLSAERLEQEAALLMTKADINEELDRLIAHVGAARDLLKSDGAIGRKLDFLCQEFNREANTLCSKSGDVELTRIGLDMKAMIEQFREQVQNIE